MDTIYVHASVGYAPIPIRILVRQILHGSRSDPWPTWVDCPFGVIDTTQIYPTHDGVIARDAESQLGYQKIRG